MPAEPPLSGAKDLTAARFWELTSKTFAAGDGTYRSDDRAGLTRYAPADVLRLPARADAGLDDCGTSETWLSRATALSQLRSMPRGAQNRYAVEVPAGVERVAAPAANAELEELIREELRRAGGGPADDAFMRDNLAHSAKFKGEKLELWYVSSYDELHQFLTVYVRVGSQERRRALWFDFVAACD